MVVPTIQKNREHLGDPAINGHIPTHTAESRLATMRYFSDRSTFKTFVDMRSHQRRATGQHSQYVDVLNMANSIFVAVVAPLINKNSSDLSSWNFHSPFMPLFLKV